MARPGAFVATAIAIALAAQPAPRFTVGGTLRTFDGAPLLDGEVRLSLVVDGRAFPAPVGDVRLLPDGGYTFAGVPPGEYLVRARGRTSREGVALFASFGVKVDDRHVAGADLTLAPGAVVEGRVAVEMRPGAAPPAVARARIRAPLADDAGFGDVHTGTIDESGAFAIRGVAPGLHQLLVEGLPFPWLLSQGSHRGRALLGLTIDTRSSERVADLRLTLAERAAAVAGRVTRDGGDGGSAGDAIVIAFPADRGLRLFPARYVRTARPDARGDYRAGGFPDGEYLLIAVVGIEEPAATSPAGLARLEPEAVRISLPAAAVTVRDLEARLAPPLPRR